MSEPTDRPTPPYDDRQQSGSVDTDGSKKDGANVGGATGPVAGAESASHDPSGGTGTTPADEQPASEMPETDRDDDRVGPAHTPGTGQGQDKS
jgi:hypothetical protein